ncbi:response regulator transcription factor [Cryobacterium sp. 10I1]|uniref:response regulator transcription factor n=1 Tax=unclassified Cryobacterium TaxID=2649013 RepID=UPI002AC928EF|nr:MULTISPECIES: response regulator transcription factor [unclassified Cryobacterium]MEB0003583.1 response regulator transcription factor [Cryobacterium sp. RTC2.1]MEB0202547.1 response regulator transcription factor [Cryobacterium sp. 5I3]MEB0288142.1 response regulator transcription factor [Cryobacterium sp. 10S3]MEB0306116.1 response regulator transcription factor [Cryobacterium sp. 10I1]WPX14346.1 response regulator transcription factor [Cryobacterium sp. 10S3]
MPTVLVVEDERDIRDILRRYLERAGFAVLTATSGVEALRLLSACELVLLDLGLPDIDGTDILREIHTLGTVPVIVLTARSTTEDRIQGLELGADDYVTKPFSPHEVVLRVQAVLHRYGGSTTTTGPTSYGGRRLRIDDSAHQAWLDGAALDLTPTEWGLLAAVSTAPGRVYSRYELVNRVRGYEYAGYERTIDSHIKNLRHKLGPGGADIIETVLGVGYRLALRQDEPS